MPFGGWWFGTGCSHGWSRGRSGGSGRGWSGGWEGRLSEENLSLLLLSLLDEEGPLQRVELVLRLEERSNGGLEADTELVYPLLQLLVDREWVAVHTVEGEERYQLTDAGHEKLEARRSRVRRLWGLARGGAPITEEDEAMIEDAVEHACHSVGAAVREVTDALGELFGTGQSSSSRRRARRGRHRGPGCC